MTAELAHDAVLSRLGAVLPIFSKMPRAVLVAGPGRKFVGGDWSNIQGRINAWIAGEEWKLQAFRDYDAGTGPDLYRATFAATFGMRVEDVDEGRSKGPQRQVGKTMELACLAGDQLIRTDAGLVPIEHVTLQHRVWDGWEFVMHGGVVAQGPQPTVEFSGLCATPDHLVWDHERTGWSGEPVPFGQVATRHKSPRAWANMPQQLTPVFDILDCGPRQSFVTANGWRVHNCGFQGSLGAWLRFDPKPSLVTKITREREFGSDRWRLASEQFDKSTKRYGLTPDEWIAVKVVVSGWRAANSAITQSWWDLQDAAVAAVDQPETLVPVLGGRVGYLVTEGFLCCRLPTGKILYYCRPRLVETREDFLVDEEGELIAIDELGEDEVAARVAAGATIREGRSRTQVQFDGPHPKTGRMCSQRLYGGLQNNHVVQGLEVEILKPAMARVKAAGYPIVLETYDSIMSEVAQGFGSAAEFESLMGVLAPELAGLPLASKAWEGVRYVE